MIELHRIVTGSLKENCYVVSCGEDAVIVDPGGGLEQIVAYVSERGLRVHAVLNTHGHVDHLAAAVPVVEEYGAPFHLHPDDAYLLPRANFYRRFIHGEEKVPIPAIDVPLAGDTTLRFGALEVGVVHTPGHSPGSVCFRIGDELFTGDTVTSRNLDSTALPGSDPEALEASLGLLAETCPAELTIHPGHGGPVRAGEALSRAALPELRG